MGPGQGDADGPGWAAVIVAERESRELRTRNTALRKTRRVRSVTCEDRWPIVEPKVPDIAEVGGRRYLTGAGTEPLGRDVAGWSGPEPRRSPGSTRRY